MTIKHYTKSESGSASPADRNHVEVGLGLSIHSAKDLTGMDGFIVGFLEERFDGKLGPVSVRHIPKKEVHRCVIGVDFVCKAGEKHDLCSLFLCAVEDLDKVIDGK